MRIATFGAAIAACAAVLGSLPLDLPDAATAEVHLGLASSGGEFEADYDNVEIRTF